MSTATAEKFDAYTAVADRVIAMLEDGVVPWRKPWKPGAAHRSIHGHTYRGINVFLLEMAAQTEGYGSPFWVTYKQAKERGGSVRKGEHSTLIIFWKRLKTIDKESGEEKFIPMLRYYRVFNLEQTEGCTWPKAVAEWEPPPVVEGWGKADTIISGYVAPMGEGPKFAESATEAAYYVPSLDRVTVPMKSRFADLAEFYSTAYHELGHSTGHHSRLARFADDAFGSHGYGIEELAAEMTATMLMGEAGIEAPDAARNSVAYIAGWITNIREDPRCLVKAGAAAQRAVDLILGRTFEDDLHTVKEES